MRMKYKSRAPGELSVCRRRGEAARCVCSARFPSQKRRVIAFLPLVNSGAQVPAKDAQRGEKRRCKAEKEGLGDARSREPSLSVSPLGWHSEDLGSNPASATYKPCAPRRDTHPHYGSWFRSRPLPHWIVRIKCDDVFDNESGRTLLGKGGF